MFFWNLICHICLVKLFHFGFQANMKKKIFFLTVFTYFGCAGWAAWAFSLVVESGTTLSSGAWASYCGGFSCCCGPWARGHAGLSSCSSQALGHRLNSCGACGSGASLLHSMWDLPHQGSISCLLHWQADSLPLSHQGSPRGRFLSTGSPGKSPK